MLYMQKRPLRVLIADDAPDILDRLAMMVNELGPQVQLVGRASDGIEALDLFHALRPDAVILDLQMPGLTGLEFIYAIRSNDASPRIIVLSVFESEELSDRLKSAGADHFIAKCGDLEAIGGLLRNMVNDCEGVG